MKNGKDYKSDLLETGVNTAELNIHSNEYNEVTSQQEETFENNVKKMRVNGNDNNGNKLKYRRGRRGRRGNKLSDEEKLKKEEAKRMKVLERDNKLVERLAKMSPKRREIFEGKLKKKEDLRVKKKAMSKDELKEFRMNMKEERIERWNKKIVDKMERMSDKQVAKLKDKLKLIEEKRERLKGETDEEKIEYRRQKMVKSQEKNKRFTYLADNWTDELPVKVDHLIVDGNNLRGGGPKRKSRDDIIGRVASVVEKCDQLRGANIICMFDKHIANYGKVDGIDVQFSGDVIADDVIVKMVKDYDGVVLVVTCDRGLALRILDMNDNLSEELSEERRYKVMRNKSFTQYKDLD